MKTFLIFLSALFLTFAVSAAVVPILPNIFTTNANPTTPIANGGTGSTTGIGLIKPLSPLSGGNGFTDMTNATPDAPYQFAYSHFNNANPFLWFSASTTKGDWAHSFVIPIQQINDPTYTDGTAVLKINLKGGPNTNVSGDCLVETYDWCANRADSGGGNAIAIMGISPTNSLMSVVLDSVGCSFNYVPTNRISHLIPGCAMLVFNENDSYMKGLAVASPGISGFDTGNWSIQFNDFQHHKFRVPAWQHGVRQPNEQAYYAIVTNMTGTPSPSDVYSNNTHLYTVSEVGLSGTAPNINGTLILSEPSGLAPQTSGTLTKIIVPGLNNSGDSTVTFIAVVRTNFWQDAFVSDPLTGTTMATNLTVGTNLSVNGLKWNSSNTGQTNSLNGGVIDPNSVLRVTNVISSVPSGGNGTTVVGFDVGANQTGIGWSSGGSALGLFESATRVVSIFSPGNSPSGVNPELRMEGNNATITSSGTGFFITSATNNVANIFSGSLTNTNNIQTATINVTGTASLSAIVSTNAVTIGVAGSHGIVGGKRLTGNSTGTIVFNSVGEDEYVSNINTGGGTITTATFTFPSTGVVQGMRIHYMTAVIVTTISFSGGVVFGTTQPTTLAAGANLEYVNVGSNNWIRTQ